MINLKCECGNVVYDIYTTKERINQLYTCHTTAGWAKQRLNNLIDMLDKDKPHIKFPPDIDWIRDKIIEVEKGITLIKDKEGGTEDEKNK